MKGLTSRTSPRFVRIISLFALVALFVSSLPLAHRPASASLYCTGEASPRNKNLPNLDLQVSNAHPAPDPLPERFAEVLSSQEVAGATQSPASAPPSLKAVAFNDVDLTHPYNPYIDIIKQRGVTVGCGGNPPYPPPVYCPAGNVTRAEMAVFIERSLGVFEPPTPAGQTFTDVPPNFWAYKFIEDFATRGITAGCGGGNFCPNDYVTREQMVTFLERAVGRPAPPEPYAAALH